MTQVYWPAAVGELWGGAFGNARIHKGKAVAITSDGVRHAIDE